MLLFFVSNIYMHAATFTFFGQIREKGERHDLSGHAYNISHNKLLRYPQKSKVKLWRAGGEWIC